MKRVFVPILLALFSVAHSQVISEEELRLKIKSVQDDCEGAHESIVYSTNEGFANDLWNKTIRFNDAMVLKFFSHSGGEKVAPGVDVYMMRNKNWAFSVDQNAGVELLIKNGVSVINSYNTQWIKARQDILHAESVQDDHKIILELYCPHQSLLQMIRTGRPQSIEFLLTGFYGGVGADSKIQGVLTKVNPEKSIIKCSNEHEYDKVTGYKFCPKCGESLN